MRVADRLKTAEFFHKAFGYEFQDKFPIDFGHGQIANCISMSPPNQPAVFDLPTVFTMPFTSAGEDFETKHLVDYHLPPEIFISDGTPGSIVGDWVAKRGGIGGVHHMAFQVENVWAMMACWKALGLAEFTSEPVECPEEGLVQVFTNEHPLTGIVYELISRKDRGFCRGSVKKLMEASAKPDRYGDHQTPGAGSSKQLDFV